MPRILVIDGAAQYAFHGGELDREMQKVLIGFGNYVVKHWDSSDQGIWEPAPPLETTLIRVCCHRLRSTGWLRSVNKAS